MIIPGSVLSLPKRQQGGPANFFERIEAVRGSCLQMLRLLETKHFKSVKDVTPCPRPLTIPKT